MKDLFKINLYLLTFIFLSTNTFAQEGFSFHVGPVFPTSDYGDDDVTGDPDAYGAGIGLGVGLQYLYPLSVDGLSVFGAASINWNPLKNDAKEDLEDNFFNQGVDITYSNYFNVPISAGLHYSVPVGTNSAIFANLGLAGNFLKITNLKGETDTDEYDLSYELTNSFGVRIGGGVYINETTSIELNYYGLGEHDLDFEVERTGFQDGSGDGDITVTFFALTIGFLLQ